MKPSLPKGTRDFLPHQSLRRQYIFDTIRSVFEKYGYAPIETPAMEALQTLTGKYGEEGDKLLFKVLNNGDYLSKADTVALESKDSNALIPSIAKRGLRYDLTVPFARFVTMHQHEIQMPFKRYQIQPVWRADRPQKGRYQEFYQCDVDVVGSESLIYEAEFIQIYDQVFAALGVRVSIHLNNRKILAGLSALAGIADQFMDMTIALDKLDKIGEDGVREELKERYIPVSSIDVIMKVIKAGSNLDKLEKLFENSEIGLQGVQEVKNAMKWAQSHQALSNEVVFDITLARGLNYYTGCIFEVKALDAEMGSIGGGGRYDDLTAAFGLKGIPGVGISFGAERIYDVMEELGLFPEALQQSIPAILLAMDDSSLDYAFKIASRLRQDGIKVDLYPEAAKMKKQFKYTDDRGFAYALICGEDEVRNDQVSVKNMKTGEQEKMTYEEIFILLNTC